MPIGPANVFLALNCVLNFYAMYNCSTSSANQATIMTVIKVKLKNGSALNDFFISDLYQQYNLKLSAETEIMLILFVVFS